jgi:predicted type IV restriction endonuclease
VDGVDKIFSRVERQEYLMDLIDKVNEISSRVSKQLDIISTEEATKNAFVMPFIQMLDYNVFNPQEVVPEFTADVGTKRGEKVDYAIMRDGEPIMLFECKHCGEKLRNNHASQLYRYFSVTPARFGVLTNGLIYEFYSDIEEPNKMDEKPFFVFDIRDFANHEVDELKKFSKSAFSLDNILPTASKLKYTGLIKNILDTELDNPSDEFVRFFASRIYSGQLRQTVIEQFREIVKEARKQFLNEKINNRLKTALSSTDNDVSDGDTKTTEEDDRNEESSDGIITTIEEIEGYNIVKAILREDIAPARVVMRDTKSYCGILLDDNNRKPVCRLFFNSSKKSLGLFKQKKMDRIPLETIDDIFKYSDQIREAVAEYDGKQQDDRNEE